MKETIFAILFGMVMFGVLIWFIQQDVNKRELERNAFCASLCTADQAKCYKYFMESGR